jgi:hypothetical protein
LDAVGDGKKRQTDALALDGRVVDEPGKSKDFCAVLDTGLACDTTDQGVVVDRVKEKFLAIGCWVEWVADLGSAVQIHQEVVGSARGTAVGRPNHEVIAARDVALEATGLIVGQVVPRDAAGTHECDCRIIGVGVDI